MFTRPLGARFKKGFILLLLLILILLHTTPYIYSLILLASVAVKHSAADVFKWTIFYIRFSPAFRFCLFRVEAFYNEKSSSERSRSGPSSSHLTFDSKTHMFRNTFFAKSHWSADFVRQYQSLAIFISNLIGFVRQYRGFVTFHIKLSRFSETVSQFVSFLHQI